ncbi:MAG: L-lactate dehydrogenase [Pseudoclavibacter sp.]|nr:L-lactate dehydrogenase [Pseudoclavibacter sp.]
MSKIAIVGAGSVGSSLAYACLIRGSARRIALYDLAEARVDAEVLDLAHGTQFTGSSTISGGADIACVEGAQVVLVTAGAKQQPGQSRLELAGANADILASLMPELLRYAPDAVYVLVTNPADVMTTIAQRISGLPANRVLSTGTLLDTSRLRWRIAEMAGGVASTSVHAMIVGEHGDSEFPLWSQATIGPVPILEWEVDGRLVFEHAALDAIAEEVRTAAYTVIAGKGATNYAIGLAGARLAEAIVRNERAVMPVSSVLNGEWGIREVALSVPSVVGANGVEQILDVPMSKGELMRLRQSADTIAAAVRSVDQAGRSA